MLLPHILVSVAMVVLVAAGVILFFVLLKCTKCWGDSLDVMVF